jgi:hypothetical protein
MEKKSMEEIGISGFVQKNPNHLETDDWDI